MTKVPSSPASLLRMQESSLNDAFFDLINEREASPKELQEVLHNLACTLLKYHEDFLKDNKDLDCVQKIAWSDDFYNLTQIVKYSGRLR